MWERKLGRPEIEHGKLTKWNWMVQYPDSLFLGANVDIGAFTYINADYGILIEDDVQIGSHCSIYSISTIDAKKGCVVLKRGCKIGSHTTIMPGVVIGENAIVGAHSFVNRHVPANWIMAGVPVKRILENV